MVKKYYVNHQLINAFILTMNIVTIHPALLLPNC
jgi:hypothetical protein